MNKKSLKLNLVIKLIIVIVLNISCNYAIAVWGVWSKWQPAFSASSGIECMIQETLFFLIFQILVIINYKIKRLTLRVYKIVYIVTDLLLLTCSVIFWWIIVVGPLWLN